MRHRLLATAACLLGALTCTAAVEPPLVGGTPADQPYPFAAALQTTSDQFFCGGSLISPSWLLTAAHCVEGRTPGAFLARIGSNDRTQGGELATPDKVLTNPDYNPAGAGGDIALVHLTKPAAAAPIGLGITAAPGATVRLLGWGQTCPDAGCGGEPVQLQQLDTQLVDPTECTAAIDPKVELCTNNPDGKWGACYGDSGGPEITQVDNRWLLLGVTSRPGNSSTTCATAPSIYTSAVAYTTWITAQIEPAPTPTPSPPAG